MYVCLYKGRISAAVQAKYGVSDEEVNLYSCIYINMYLCIYSFIDIDIVMDIVRFRCR